MSNLRLPWRTVCSENFHCVEYTFTFRIFEQLALALKNRVALKFFTVLKYFFIIQDLWATCASPENKVCPEFTILNIYFLPFRIFEQLALALKNTSSPEIFHCIEIFFIIQDFWATCACPENRVCPKILQDRRGGRPPRPPASYAYANVLVRVSQPEPSARLGRHGAVLREPQADPYIK